MLRLAGEPRGGTRDFLVAIHLWQSTGCNRGCGLRGYMPVVVFVGCGG